MSCFGQASSIEFIAIERKNVPFSSSKWWWWCYIKFLLLDFSVLAINLMKRKTKQTNNIESTIQNKIFIEFTLKQQNISTCPPPSDPKPTQFSFLLTERCIYWTKINGNENWINNKKWIKKNVMQSPRSDFDCCLLSFFTTNCIRISAKQKKISWIY